MIPKIYGNIRDVRTGRTRFQDLQYRKYALKTKWEKKIYTYIHVAGAAPVSEYTIKQRSVQYNKHGIH